MSRPPLSTYYADRAKTSRDERDLATDSSAGVVHGKLAARYDAMSEQAQASEDQKADRVRTGREAAERDEHRTDGNSNPPRATDAEDERWAGEGGGVLPSSHGAGNDQRDRPGAS